jgi:predicted GIY-YIG superfamily endonuclease
MTFHVYVLLCADGTYYTGLTSNLKRRIRQHENGSLHRAYTYSRRPVRLVWSQEFPTLEEARAGEKRVKNWAREKKDALLQTRGGQTH